MAIDNTEVIDATAYEGDKLILQLYDHLEFDDEIIKDHMFMLQEKLNSYIWFIDSKQYEETYPDANLSVYEIQNEKQAFIGWHIYRNQKTQGGI